MRHSTFLLLKRGSQFLSTGFCLLLLTYTVAPQPISSQVLVHIPEVQPFSQGNSLAQMLVHDWQLAQRQLDKTARTLLPSQYPIYTNHRGSWQTTGPRTWTSGFLPGSFWLSYERTGASIWKTRAQRWQAGLENQKYNTSTHDIGFIILSSFGNGYRLTGNDRYRQIVVRAAKSLATRYNPIVGCIKRGGEGDEFKVIIDTMMNIELLFWAAKHGGSQSWYDMAVSHALKTRENHVRPDGSTYHLVTYSSTTGKVTSRSTIQGYIDESTWSRGQAWAVYGFTVAYRETGDKRFLETARKTADYFIKHLPTDHVPFWDFQAPSIPNEPKDSSASAIVASALLELSQQEPDFARRRQYLAATKQLLTSLSSTTYLSGGTHNMAILLHGTYHKKAGNYNTGLIWGDYYFLEALLRYQRIVSSAISSSKEAKV